MKLKEFLDLNRKELASAEAEGLNAVSPTTLRKIFDQIESLFCSGGDLHPGEMEKFRSALAGSLAHEERQNTWSLEQFRQILVLGQSALKSVMLINGGAAVALLAFIGNLSGKTPPTPPVLPFANSLWVFVFGVFLAAVAYGLTYLGQLCYAAAGKWPNRLGIFFHVLTVLASVGGLAAFLCGSQIAYSGFLGVAL